MSRRLFSLGAAVAVVALAAACNEDSQPSAPTGPSFKPVPTPSFPCAFTGNPSLSNAANAYFTTTADRKTASDYITRMQAGFTASSFAGARDPGFDLLRFTGFVSRGSTAGDTASGGLLVRQAVQCMFDVSNNNSSGQEFFGWPSDPQFDYGHALAASAGGAFFVRGGTGVDPTFFNTADPSTAAVIATDPSRIPFGGVAKDGNISGIAPNPGSTWPTSVHNSAGNRVLVYGQPVAGGYDWKLLPRLSTSFSPPVVVALCPAASPAAGNTADMVSQENVGVLGYIGADFICNTDPTDNVTISLFGRLTHFAAGLLSPAPLQATVLTSTIGGSASGAKGDIFSVENVPAVTLTMTNSQNWSTVKVNADRGTISVQVATPAPESAPVGGVTVTLSAVNNNGFTQVGQLVNGVCQAPAPSKTTVAEIAPGGTSAATIVTWTHTCITKTGAVSVLANSQADGRSGGVGTTQSPKFNVKP